MIRGKLGIVFGVESDFLAHEFVLMKANHT